jgi:hypothetical protein
MTLLEGVLSKEEKQCFRTRKWKQLLAVIFPSALQPRRKKAHVVCQLPNFCNCYCKHWHGSVQLVKRVVLLQTDKRAELVGVHLNTSRDFKKWHSGFTFELLNARNERMGKGDVLKGVTHEGFKYCKLSPRCILEANAEYSVRLLYCGPEHPLTYQSYTLHDEGTVASGWLTLRVESALDLIELRGMSFLFIKA